jgi:hypothetical protein
MSKHTPGPWKYLDKNGKFLDSKGWEAENYHCDNFSYVPVTDGKSVVALVVVKGDDTKALINHARLIASAPELLEALIDCREALRRAGATGELKVVDAAIAKAIGEA